jgi:DNA invertase Pin-like site-specific DNA recombinase
MMRAAIYARFSSENQSASSIADQIEVSSRYITKSGWAAVTTYSDAAMSGASRFRPGYQQLLADLDRGLFDVVVVEALDRLGRKLADIADLYDRCTFAGITLGRCQRRRDHRDAHRHARHHGAALSLRPQAEDLAWSAWASAAQQASL